MKTELNLNSADPWFQGPAFLQKNEEGWPETPKQNSSLKNVEPYMDENEVLRMKTRIQNAATDDQTKNPIILPKGDSLIRSLLLDYHRRHLHGFNETVCNEIRQRFYIAHLRVEVKTVSHKCPLCIMRRARPKPPQMAALPKARVAVNTKPFAYAGLDYFGPLLVKAEQENTKGQRNQINITKKRGRPPKGTNETRTRKVWGVLITCLTTRACYLDLTSSLSSDHAVMVLERFFSRRGEPIEIYCDNATTFRGVDAALADQVDLRGSEEKFYKIKFKYNPPAAPHMGGSWERIIRTVKDSLKVILKDHVPTLEVLATAFAQIEGIINSRPLTYVTLDNDAVEALTPNHLLLGQSNTARPLGRPPQKTMAFTKQFHRANVISQAFWTRWIKEYLPTLMRRTKWFQTVAPIQIGDVGAIWDTSIRNSWQLGRVVATCPSRDGQVRTIEVATKNGIYRRPASKFAKFDISDCQESSDDHGGGDVGNRPSANEDDENLLNTAFIEEREDCFSKDTNE